MPEPTALRGAAGLQRPRSSVRPDHDLIPRRFVVGGRGEPMGVSRPVGRSGAVAQRVVVRHLDERDPHPVRVRDPHLDQPPRFLRGRPQYAYARRRQFLVRSVGVGDLQPQLQPGRRMAPRSGPIPPGTHRRGSRPCRDPARSRTRGRWRGPAPPRRRPGNVPDPWGVAGFCCLVREPWSESTWWVVRRGVTGALGGVGGRAGMGVLVCSSGRSGVSVGSSHMAALSDERVAQKPLANPWVVLPITLRS